MAKLRVAGFWSRLGPGVPQSADVYHRVWLYGGKPVLGVWEFD